MIKLTKVQKKKDHIDLLYSLLKQRKISISHKSIPSKKNHQEFVSNHPYREWFLVFSEDEAIGSVYLSKDNSIGIFLKRNDKKEVKYLIELILKEYKPLKPIKSVRGSYFHFNVNPDDKFLIKVLLDLRMKHIQSTFILYN